MADGRKNEGGFADLFGYGKRNEEETARRDKGGDKGRRGKGIAERRENEWQ